MKLTLTIFSKLSVISLLSIFATSSALAGANGTMTYSITSGIPTLSGSMLIVLSLLLFVVALKVAKQKTSAGNKMFITFLGVTALSIGGGGIKLVSDADALIAIVDLNLNLTSTTGEIQVFNGTNIFENPNAGTLTITNITPPAGSNCGGAVAPPIECSVSLQLPTSAQCQLLCAPAVSDIRLKQDVKYLTKLQNGLKLYSFRYIPAYTSNATNYVGVMAQDLLKDSRYKDAVLLMDNDFYAVDYNVLGLKMVTLDQWQESPANIFKL